MSEPAKDHVIPSRLIVCPVCAGKLARSFIDKAREQVARMINCEAEG